jgi:hypothetical protein
LKTNLLTFIYALIAIPLKEWLNEIKFLKKNSEEFVQFNQIYIPCLAWFIFQIYHNTRCALAKTKLFIAIFLKWGWMKKYWCGSSSYFCILYFFNLYHACYTSAPTDKPTTLKPAKPTTQSPNSSNKNHMTAGEHRKWPN